MSYLILVPHKCLCERVNLPVAKEKLIRAAASQVCAPCSDMSSHSLAGVGRAQINSSGAARTEFQRLFWCCCANLRLMPETRVFSSARIMPGNHSRYSRTGTAAISLSRLLNSTYLDYMNNLQLRTSRCQQLKRTHRKQQKHTQCLWQKRTQRH